MMPPSHSSKPTPRRRFSTPVSPEYSAFVPSDSCDSAANNTDQPLVTVSNGPDSESGKAQVKLKKKKKKHSFSKGILDLITLGSSTSSVSMALAAGQSQASVAAASTAAANDSGSKQKLKHRRQSSANVIGYATPSAASANVASHSDSGIIQEDREDREDMGDSQDYFPTFSFSDEPVTTKKKDKVASKDHAHNKKQLAEKKLVDTVVPTDVDSLFKSVFDNEHFFELVSLKAHEEVRNFHCGQWIETEQESNLFERRLKYEISKTIAFSRQNITVQQTQVQCQTCQIGQLYEVDTVTMSSGVVYADYFRLNIRFRFTAEDDTRSSARLTVMANIEFVKPCLFKGRIESEAWSGLKKYYEILEKEVQLERLPDPIDSTNIQMASVPALDRLQALKTQQSTAVPTNAQAVPQGTPRCWGLSPEAALGTLVLVLLVLLLTTLTMYKLSGVMQALSGRLDRIEDVLEGNARLFSLMVRDKYHYQGTKQLNVQEEL